MAASEDFSDGMLLHNAEGRPNPGLRARIIGFFWATFLRLLCRTWRKQHEGFDAIDEAREQGAKLLLCFWHGQYIPVMALCRWLWIEKRAEDACVFTSRSARGAVISEICRNFGLDCILIPDKGQKYSYALMRSALSQHSAGVIAVDGPLGPNRNVKQGAIRLAADLGFHLVPASVYAKHAWVARNRWDKMEFPRWFTRIGLSMGKPVEVPANISREQIRGLMNQLGNELQRLEDRAEKLLRCC